jgi:dihydroorotate dehydrogenase
VKLWNFIKAILFKFDAEFAHRLTVVLIRMGIRFGNWPLKVVSGTLWERSSPSALVAEEIQVLGLSFQSRVGLAAGFDKNAEVLLGLPALGFGFAEIGTVTPRPQGGNPRPRLFRQPSEQSIFNRMGFNGLGAYIVAERLKQSREKLPQDFRVGVNLGKNKDTPIENAADDYIQAAQAFEGLADYLVINVSSPNTPGLRSLQTVDALKPIVCGVASKIQSWKKCPPLLLKLAPEISGHELTELIQSVEPWGIDGWVLTNTLEGAFLINGQEQKGGWSGKPLTVPSQMSLKAVRQVTRKPIISVGGIMSPEEAQARIRAGADLIQIYTGWIYQGPTFPLLLDRSLRRQNKR